MHKYIKENPTLKYANTVIALVHAMQEEHKALSEMSALHASIYEWFDSDFPQIDAAWPSDVAEDFSTSQNGVEPASYTYEEVRPVANDFYDVYIQTVELIKKAGRDE